MRVTSNTNSPTLSPQEAVAYLDSFINYERTADVPAQKAFKLERVKTVLSLLGDPHKRLCGLHVAGTKGKGSVSVYAAEILRAAGYTTGLYTSPHIYRVNERIRVLKPGQESKSQQHLFSDSIRDEDIAALLSELQPVLESMRETREFGRLSYFEVLTILAIYYFYKQKVDYAVFETGLGGRLDATNVITPLVCALTPIDLEHTKQLGNTLAEIAGEKAGIIKKRIPVVVAPQHEEALAVIDEYAGSMEAQVSYVNKDIFVRAIKQDVDRQSFEVDGRQRYRLRTSLPGEYQMLNAATAIGMMEALSRYGKIIHPQAVETGVEKAYWPCRFEIVCRDPWIIVDCAHTVNSAKALVDTWERLFPGERPLIIAGFSEDKNYKGICKEFIRVAGKIMLTKADHPRSLKEFGELKEIFQEQPSFSPDVPAAVQASLADQEARHILISGSVFVASEARKWLHQNNII